MKKILIEDVKFKKKNIPISTNYTFKNKEIIQSKKILSNYSNKEIIKRNKRYKTLLIILLVTVFISVLYWCLNMFESANVILKTKNQSFTLINKQFTAIKETDISSSSQISPIQFEIMIVPYEESKDIVLTTSENVSLKAKGIVTLYNQYSVKPELLPIHTLISDENGKTYSTDKAVSIPGYTKINNKIIPGQITINITAFLPGGSYNGSPSIFYINSFKNTPKYKNIFAKAQTTLSGGAQGQVYTIDKSTEDTLDNLANTTFKDNLFKKVKAEVPLGYVLYPNATQFSYKIDNSILSETPETNIKIDGSISTVLLKQDDLLNSLLKNLLPNTSIQESDEIKFTNMSDLTFNFLNTNQSITKDLISVPFTLSGNLNAIWQPNIESLKMKLIDISKYGIISIFKQDPGIIQASVKLFPPWQIYLPMNSSKINIDVK